MFFTIFLWLFPTKMCIKPAPYLHQKNANWACLTFFDALMLMLLTYVCLLIFFKLININKQIRPKIAPLKSEAATVFFSYDALVALIIMLICLNSTKNILSAPLQKIGANKVP